MTEANEIVLEAVGVSVKLRSGRELLSSVTFRLPKGSLLALVGPNGSGKSTLLRAMAGQQKIPAGEIRFMDRPLSEWSSEEWVRLVGYLPQQVNPAWDLRVREAVRLGMDSGPPRRDGNDFLHSILRGFDLVSLTEQRLETLSGGERARVFLAMTLARSPSVLLADEPFASLDTGHAHGLLKKLAGMKPGLSSVVVLHDLNLATAHADFLIVLERGRIRLVGPPAVVLASPEIDRVFQQPFHRVSLGDRLALVPVADGEIRRDGVLPH